MHIASENDLLNPEVRKQILKELDSPGNQCRKAEAFKAYECLKDKTVNYVLGLLLKQFSEQTVSEMQYAMTNISFLRKVIGKLARVYNNGVKRTMTKKTDTAAVEQLAEALDVTAVMKKTNRYYRTFWNTLVYVRPVAEDDGKFNLQLQALPPFHYDVVESSNNPQKAMAVILSDYAPSRQTLYSLHPESAGRTRPLPEGTGIVLQSSGDMVASKLTDDAYENSRRFIWWTKNFHFTTNVKGEIVSGEDPTNPIAMLPFVNFAGEQDGQFWAEGGSDLVDAGIKINTFITNLIHVAISQGYGQLFMTGKNLPKSVTVGPNHCVQLEYNKDEDPNPTIGYLNSNPPIDQLKGLAEMYVALMLSTNNLSTTGFSVNLQGGAGFASGIAMILDKSESIEDVEEQSAIFIKREPEVWKAIGAWLEVYGSRGLLIEDLAKIKAPKDLGTVQVTFPAIQPVTSEKERLEIIKLRKELGINTMLELIMRDNPGMTEAEAEEKLKKILEESMARAATAAVQMQQNGNAAKPGVDNGAQGNGNAGVKEPNNNDPGNSPGLTGSNPVES